MKPLQVFIRYCLCPSCWQVCTSCYQLVTQEVCDDCYCRLVYKSPGSNKLISSGCYKRVTSRPSLLEQTCSKSAIVIKLVTSLMEQACCRLVIWQLGTSSVSINLADKLDNKLVTTCAFLRACYKSVNKSPQVCHNKLLSAVRRQLVDKLLEQALGQVCCRFVTTCAFLRV